MKLKCERYLAMLLRDVESVLDWCVELVNTLNRDGGGEEGVLCGERKHICYCRCIQKMYCSGSYQTKPARPCGKGRLEAK